MAGHDSEEWMPWRPGPGVDDRPGRIELRGYRDFVPIARSEGSEVYRAHQAGVDRPVAVKLLLLDDPEAVARFQRELAITVQLGRQHPHIVTVIDTGTTTDGRPCIVMEHYDRGSLHDRLRTHGPLPWGEVLAAGTVVADALSFAHRHGVLHRDVKPQNVLVLPTSYVVADFGIARRIDAARTTSVEWFSFRHAAPQVLDGDPPAVADDIWSVGSTMFTLLDGLPPFASGNAAEDTALAYMKRVRTGRPRRLVRDDVPAGLLAIIDRCLRHDRAERFADAAALHAALGEFAAETRGWAPPEATGFPSAEGLPPSGLPPTGRVGTGASTGASGRGAAGPPVVPIQPAAMVRHTAPPLPPTGTRPPTATPPPTGTRPAAAPLPASTPAVPDDATVMGQPGALSHGALSPSALARLVANSVAEGGYRVGDETTGTTGPYVAPPTDAPSSPAPARSVQRVLLGTLIALLVGGVLGIGGVWVSGLAREDSDGAEGSTGQAGQTAGGAARATGAPAATGKPSTAPSNINNSRIAPTITQLDVDRTTVLVKWRDPSKGRAQFIVVRVRDGHGEPVREVPAGTSQAAIDGLDPKTRPYCFLVIAVLGDRGVSPTRCSAAT